MTVAGSRSERASPAVRLGLAALLVASFALRAWSGSVALHAGRNFDERFTLHNVQALLVRPGFSPANGYYPSLSFLPQTLLVGASQALYRATGWGPAQALDLATGRFTATGYLLCRWLSALYGTLSLALVYRLGRRLFTPAAGLAAATFLAAMPAHVTSSTQIKPDILVVLLALVALDLAWTAAETPGARSYALAGGAIGLAVAAKYTGVGSALPLVALSWLDGGWRSARRWGLLALAAASSLAVFLLLNPNLPLVLGFLPELAAIYQRKGAAAGGSHLDVLTDEARFLARHHGKWLAGALLPAAGWLLARAFRGGVRERRLAACLLAWPLGYSLLYAAATTLFKGQNYLPVGASTSFLLGAGVVGLAAWAAAGWPWLRRRAVVWTGAALGSLVLFWLPVGAVYREVVPSTAGLAASRLLAALRPVEERSLAYERREGQLIVTENGLRAGAYVVPSLAELPAEVLDLTDAEVFPAARLGGDAAELYAGRLARLPASGIERVAPSWWRAHGPELVLALHPWRRLGEAVVLARQAPAEPDAARRRRTFVLPTPSPEAPVASLLLELRREAEPGGEATIEVAGQPLPLWLTQGRGRRGLFLTPRFRLSPGAEALPVRLPRGYSWLDEVPPRLQLWAAPPGLPAGSGATAPGGVARSALPAPPE